MTQRQHEPVRDEVSDLRNIVDRLDMLMGNAQSAAVPRTSSTAEMVAALDQRVDTIADDVTELRTLVNHLMTIATWQAKVTATLVDDRADDDRPHADTHQRADDDHPRDEHAPATQSDPEPEHAQQPVADSYQDDPSYGRSNGAHAERPAAPRREPPESGDDVDEAQRHGFIYDDRTSRWRADSTERMPAGGWRRERDESYGWDDRRYPPERRHGYESDHDDDLRRQSPRRDGSAPDFGI